ncbi:hypothetical protein ACFWG5_34435 [Streptomyces hydrogenans]|uniref:hypothetical protein n=1 Tax=Streptomyces hydrogenans TaxID=1873719 RepID=UPI0036483C47
MAAGLGGVVVGFAGLGVVVPDEEGFLGSGTGAGVGAGGVGFWGFGAGAGLVPVVGTPPAPLDGFVWAGVDVEDWPLRWEPLAGVWRPFPVPLEPDVEELPVLPFWLLLDGF